MLVEKRSICLPVRRGSIQRKTDWLTTGVLVGVDILEVEGLAGGRSSSSSSKLIQIFVQYLYVFDKNNRNFMYSIS